MRLNIDRMDRHRVLAGFTKRSLARAVNVSEATIYRLFAGKSRSPGLIRKSLRGNRTADERSLSSRRSAVMNLKKEQDENRSRLQKEWIWKADKVFVEVESLNLLHTIPISKRKAPWTYLGGSHRVDCANRK